LKATDTRSGSQACRCPATRVMKAIRSASVAKLVVVIDDDPLILEATEGLLRSWGCCVVAARSCDEALYISTPR